LPLRSIHFIITMLNAPFINKITTGKVVCRFPYIREVDKHKDKN